MRVRHELKRGKESQRIGLFPGSAAQMDQRSSAGSHHAIWDEDKVYEPDWEISTVDLEPYAGISSED